MGSIIRASRVLGLLAGVAIAVTACSSTTAGIPQSSPVGGSQPAPPAAVVPAPSLGSGGDAAFCAAAAKIGMELFGGPGAANITEAEGMQKIGDAWVALAAIAPADIKADVTQIANGIKSAGSGAAADPAAVMTALGEPMQRYSAWGQTHCPGLSSTVKPGG